MPDALWLGPLVGGVLLLAVCGWRREMRRRKERAMDKQRAERAEQLPQGAADIYLPEDRLARADREQLLGSQMFVVIGTYGANQVLRSLVLLARCGLEGLVGSILVIEQDSQLRAKFERELPAAFRDRVVYASSAAHAGGFSGRPIGWALARIDRWGPAILEATERAIDIHLRRNANRAPAEILTFISQGGHGVTGLLPVEVLHQRFEESLLVGLTSLPLHRRLRGRYAELKAAYEERGLFGWIVQDNLAADAVTLDAGMVNLIVGLAEAALHADQSTQLNNALSLVFSEAPGSVLVYQVATASLASYAYDPDGSGQARYYVQQQPLIEQVLKTLRALDLSQGIWSVDVPAGAAGSSTFDLVALPLRHEDLLAVEDAVRAGLGVLCQAQ